MDAADAYTMNFLREQNRLLRDRIEVLEETVTQLREQLGAKLDLPEGLPHLTRKESEVLRLLIARPLVTRAMAMMALYSDRAEEPLRRIIDTFICRLRAKLNPMGITIGNRIGEGWYLTVADRAALKALSPEAATCAA